jgi:isopentenyl-diphosphate delta-isomerase
MGFVCALAPIGSMIYRADVGSGLIEHEFVHLFAGEYQGPVKPDAAEAEAHAWRSLEDVRREAQADPECFTAWFRRYLSEPNCLSALERQTSR